jgi:myo-inositol-1(or 4)-monophosphatase
VEASELIEVCRRASDAVRETLAGLSDWGLADTRPGQYRSDLAADDAAIAVLSGAGLGVLSEESGLHDEHRALLAVLDPVDGSANAARQIPWYATSICVLDDEGPLAAFVVNQASGVTYEATRGGGALRDGVPITAAKTVELRRAMIGLSGYPRRYLGWRQYRAFGAAALDLCLVADGRLDGYVDCARDAHGPWDYLGGMLVCTEAGAAITEREGRDLVVRRQEDRRSPIAAATPELLAELHTKVREELFPPDEAATSIR